MDANGGHSSNALENNGGAHSHELAARLSTDYGWGKGAAVEKWLFAEGHRFDFFQAVRLLEMIHAAGAQPDSDVNGLNGKSGPGLRFAPGEGADPSKEIVRFSSTVSLDFPASDIAEVNSGHDAKEPNEMVDHFKRREMPARMSVNFLGLAGGLGTLDMPTTERVLQRTSRNDSALKDFLDIFNHRLVSLLYRIRKHHRVGIDVAGPGKDQISDYLYSFIGLGTPNLQGRMHVRDRALLYYAGLLAQQPRSMVGLERLLADYFQVKVNSRQFSGAWCDLEESQLTAIGVKGRNQRLGRDAVILGSRVWDPHARFEIHLGPLSLEEFTCFLPTGWAFGALCDLIQFYVKNEFDFSIRLILKAAEIPSTKLTAEQPELSWTTWLGFPKTNGNGAGPPAKQKDPYITISPESLRAADVSINSLILYRLPRGKQAELFAKMDEKTVSPNTVVMLQGRPAAKMYVIRTGKVQLSRCDGPGKETVVRILGPGDVFGESALLLGKPYNRSALALTECEILTIDRKQLDDFVAGDPDLQRTKDNYTGRSESGRKSAGKLEKVKR
jgi:type VI secretion system protein ImpH